MIPTQAQLDREAVRRYGLIRFVELAWPHVVKEGPFVPNWHLDEMCAHAEALTPPMHAQDCSCGHCDKTTVVNLGNSVRWHEPILRDLYVGIPPSHTKTKLWCVFWPAWVWTFRPEFRWMFASYAPAVSNTAATEARELCESRWYIERWGPMIDRGKRFSMGDYYTLAGGRRFSTFIGGPATGIHAHAFVVDDAVKAQAAQSIGDISAALDQANKWDANTRPTRALDPQTYINVLIGQRLSENDMPQQWLDRGVTSLVLPALYEPERHSVTIVGGDRRSVKDEPLFPGRFPREELDKIVKPMGGWDSPVAQAQLQQNPGSKHGLIFKKETFKRFKASELPIRGMHSAISIDCNFKKSEVSSDVGIAIGGWGSRKAFIYEAISENLGFVDALKMIKLLITKWQPDAILIEDKANGPATIEMLRLELPNVLAPDPKSSKEERAHAANVYWQAGCVYHNSEMGGLGIEGYEELLAKFPRGKKKDPIDATTQLVLYLATKDTTSFDEAMRQASGELNRAAGQEGFPSLGGFFDHFTLR